jgi:hypothetical protein
MKILVILPLARPASSRRALLARGIILGGHLAGQSAQQSAATVASKTSASASVITRQIVAFDGGRAGRAPARMYRSASRGAGRP